MKRVYVKLFHSNFKMQIKERKKERENNDEKAYTPYGKCKKYA